MKLLILSLAIAFTLLPTTASAQQYLFGADAGLSTGMEGGGPLAMRMTRARLRLGIDARLDEAPEDIWEIGALAELMPKSAFGADARYARNLSERFMVDAGVMGILAPSSLYGVCAGLTYRFPISKKSLVTFGPEGDFYFLGTDLPNGTVIWQFRFQAGFHVDM